MRWASTVSEAPELETALDEITAALTAQLDGGRPDLLVAFVSEHHEEKAAKLPELLAARLPGLLVGCTAGGVIGGGHEVEGKPGVAVTAAVLPGVELHPFHLPRDLPLASDPEAPPSAWQALADVDPAADPHFLVLADPFDFDAQLLVSGLDAAFPRAVKIGGLASGGAFPGSHSLFLGRHVQRFGAVAVGFTGNIEVDAIVAQGCRPIGQPMFVTACRENLLLDLNRRRVMEVLREIHDTLDERDRELFRNSLFLGMVMDEGQQEYHLGDFLIRNIIGRDQSTNGLAVGAVLRELQVVQFHLRDARTSTEELQLLLDRYHMRAVAAPEGALLFSCMGRGTGLYGEGDHDTNLFKRALGNVALGGFFGNGEIGPVRGSTFLHGYTSSFGLFRRKV